MTVVSRPPFNRNAGKSLVALDLPSQQTAFVLPRENPHSITDVERAQSETPNTISNWPGVELLKHRNTSRLKYMVVAQIVVMMVHLNQYKYNK